MALSAGVKYFKHGKPICKPCFVEQEIKEREKLFLIVYFNTIKGAKQYWQTENLKIMYGYEKKLGAVDIVIVAGVVDIPTESYHW